MGYRESLMATADAARQLLGSAGANVVRGRVEVITRSWSGGSAGDGEPVDSVLVLPDWYQLEELNEKEIASSGGRYRMGAVKLRVTPAEGLVGHTIAQVAPQGSQGVEIVYRITGDISGDFARVNLMVKPFRYELTLERISP